MKKYPTIPREIRYGVDVCAFDKLDGSNIRAEWSPKKKFWKFGRRRGLLDHSNPILLRAPKLIQAKYADDLDHIFREQRWQRVVAFFEFWGRGSAYGQHVEGEIQDVTLIDVAIHRKGLLEPRAFLKAFKHVEHAKPIWQGRWNKATEACVAEGTLPDVTFEAREST